MPIPSSLAPHAHPLVPLVLVLSLGPFACAEDGEPRGPGFDATAYANGTRLRARVEGLEGGRGDPIHLGWRDSEFELDCELRVAADGQVRCLPWHQPRSGFNPADLVYARADCTEPLLLLDATLERAPRFTVGLPSVTATCETRPAVAPLSPSLGSGEDELLAYPVLEVGERVRPGQLYLRSGNECRPFTDDRQQVYALGAEVPPDRFAAAELVPEEGEGGVERWFYRFDDGAFELAGVRDRMRDAWCGPLPSWPETICVPLRQAWVERGAGLYYGDAACEAPAPLTFRFSACEPEIVVEPGEVAGACGRSAPPKVFEPGARVTTPYRQDGATCLAEDGSLGEPLDDRRHPRSLGAEIPLGSFPTLAVRQVESGQGQGLGWFDARGVQVSKVATLVDPTTGRPCVYRRFADGTERCLPDGTKEPFGFADADCQEPVFRGPGDCEGDRPFGMVMDRVQRVRSVFELGPPHAGRLFVTFLEPGKCQEIPLDDPGSTHFARGAEVPFERFSKIVRRTE